MMVFYYSSPLTFHAMSTSAHCRRNNDGTSMWAVSKIDVGGVDVEATKIQWEDIQLNSWDVRLNSGTGRNKVVKERLQQVPQQTAAPITPVQRTVFCYLSP